MHLQGASASEIPFKGAHNARQKLLFRLLSLAVKHALPLTIFLYALGAAAWPLLPFLSETARTEEGALLPGAAHLKLRSTSQLRCARSFALQHTCPDPYCFFAGHKPTASMMYQIF